ncbi:hypothetical protein WR164_00970 [Philodulcilactobacillus myokoensis]|uniref:Uncharacterized protein n=1 Tax=Philodulcilactobacillus myokoensis TaxID=2929573 RepID=A0A9W6ES89_9LACO|nr:hypothetical protein [Philodulcilactobacillus myokoensis]GLB46118.1 hypothetical protein WR164_00970 [Philodulcilactobacillus myokoensis]
MPKLHHKLQNLTDYINQDLRLAEADSTDDNAAVDLATATIGVALGDMDKASRMRPIVDASLDSYNNKNHKYNMKVAIFVSKHSVMSDDDYLKIKVGLGTIADDQKKAKGKLPLPRHKFMNIF